MLYHTHDLHIGEFLLVADSEKWLSLNPQKARMPFGEYAQLFGGLAASRTGLVAATLAVAVLFRPARRRIQAGVDRPFNRRRYDAASIIESFVTRLRQAIDLDELLAELLAVVNQTTEAHQCSRPLIRSGTGGAAGTSNRHSIRM